MARKTREESLNTKNRILDAAELVLLEKGVGQTAMADIAEAAGMSRGAVYGHFNGKIEVRVDDQPVDPLVALANAQNTLSAMQLDAFRRAASEARFRLASGATPPLGFAQINAPLWAEFATDTSTLRAIFNTHYATS